MSGGPAGHGLVFHHMYRNSEPAETLAWLKGHYYRALLVAGVEGEGQGIVAQRDDECPIVATVGSTFTYDPATGLVTVQ